MGEAPGEVEERWRGQESWDLLHQAHLHLQAEGGQLLGEDQQVGRW